jgi:integrase
MAELFKRGKQIWISYNLAGKRVRRSLELDDNAENRVIAKKIKKEIEYKLVSGDILEKIKKYRDLTLSEGFKQFIEMKESKSEKTKSIYEYSFKKLIKVTSDRRIRDYDESLLKKFEEGLSGLSKNTIEIIFRHLRIIFQDFVNKKYIAINPIPKKEKQEKKIRIISDNEMDIMLKLLKKENIKHYRIIKLLSLTGLRISELLRMEFEDLDFKRGIMIIRNEKGRRMDEFPMYQQLKDFFETEFGYYGKGRLFDYKTKDSLKFFQRFLVKNHFNHYSFHDIRKSFLSKLINKKISLYDLQVIARHKDIRTTKKYYLKADLNRIGKEIEEIFLDTVLDTVGKKAAFFSQN